MMKYRMRVIIALIILFVAIGAAHAATTMEIGIPGQINPGDAAPTIPEYIKYLYLFVLGFVGIAGFASIVFWGAVWAGSGVVDKKAAALDGIKNALYGIGIALTAFILLYTINPDLTVIKAPSVADIKITAQNNSSTPQQIKYQDDVNYCNNLLAMGCAQSGGKCQSMNSGNGNVCEPYYVFACNSFTEVYNNCKDNRQCMEQKKSDCNQYVPISDGKCQWLTNSCVYVPNSK